jgi:CRISPR-associated endonuclease/helicase Cas3
MPRLLRSFEGFFAAATGVAPYTYQSELASSRPCSQAINVPTGAGKTAAVILAWLWNRCGHGSLEQQASWPRRLVFCLPMRTLVEQTRREADQWIKKLIDLELIDANVQAFTLMGGETEESWERFPERPALLIGTQDMLLSRSLNRGYAMSRYRWPIQFGLLNNDVLWICDEVQLMGPAFETTLQLDAFRKHRWGVFGPSFTWWMSATLDEKSFQTVDRLAIEKRLGKSLLTFSANSTTSLNEDPRLASRLKAVKAVRVVPSEPKAAEIIQQHQGGTLSLVVFNTVKKAREFYLTLVAERSLTNPSATKNPSGIQKDAILLLHSQFRPNDRRVIVERLLKFENDRRAGTAPVSGMIVVTTQVIEAGVDISAQTMWSQVAPWASVVQRLGRLNRDGKSPKNAAMFWLDTSKGPYELDDLEAARDRLTVFADDARNGTEDFGQALREFPVARKPEIVIRPRDIWELCDTDPDMHGGFTDISRYIRAVDHEIHAFVMWRDFDPAEVQAELAPTREELCPVPFYDLADFLNNQGTRAWLFYPNDDKTWEMMNAKRIRAGMTILLPKQAGGYRPDVGWTGAKEEEIEVFTGNEKSSFSGEPRSLSREWETLADHTTNVVSELRRLLSALKNHDLGEATLQSLEKAALWHDRGKAHPRWQQAIEAFGAKAELPPPTKKQNVDSWAKSMDASWSPRLKSLTSEEREKEIRSLRSVFRPGLRHECASALAARHAWLNDPNSQLGALTIYLIASHHGKVRFSLRSSTLSSHDDLREAFGVRDGEVLPPTNLGGMLAPECRIDLECMELGLIERNGREEPSWMQMVADVLGPCDFEWPNMPIEKDDTDEVCNLGPFRLTMLESLLRIADWRASEQ